jgi:hypothetical protein
MAFGRRDMQWSVLTEEKQKNQLAQKEFRLIKTITIIRAAAAITRRPSPPHQLCTGAKDGKLQRGLHLQNNVVELIA